MTTPPSNPIAEPASDHRRPPTLDDERRAQVRLMAEDRIIAIGTLASGIAHEINTPIQYIGDAAHFIQEASSDLLRLLAAYRAALAAVGPVADKVLQEVRALEAGLNVEQLEDLLPSAIERVRDGTQRVARVVGAMREFGVQSGGKRTAVDINACLGSTLAVTRHALHFVGEAECELGELPPIEGDLAGLNQVFLNLVLNAIHALEDVHAETGTRGRILIRSRELHDGVEVVVADTGKGIPQEIRGRIFDPFFTTKEPGRGTGQGLTIARNIVKQGHQGTLELSELAGWATSFSVWVPRDAAP